MADQKKEENVGANGFKIVPLGFDKNEVNAYISSMRKEVREMEITSTEAKLHADKVKEEGEKAIAESESLKKEYEEKILEIRKELMEERRKSGTFEKDAVKAKMELDKLQKDYQTLKKSKGTSTAAGSGEFTTSSEAMRKAEEIVNAARDYANTVVNSVDEYKTLVHSEVSLSLSDIILKRDSAVSIFKRATEALENFAENASSAEKTIDEIPNFNFELLPKFEIPDGTKEVEQKVAAVDDDIFNFEDSDDEVLVSSVEFDEPKEKAVQPSSPKAAEKPAEAKPAEAEPIKKEAITAPDIEGFNDFLIGDNDAEDDMNSDFELTIDSTNPTKEENISDFVLTEDNITIEPDFKLAEEEPVPEEKGEDLTEDLFEIASGDGKGNEILNSLLADDDNSVGYNPNKDIRPDKREEKEFASKSLWDFEVSDDDGDDEMSSDNSGISDLLM